MAARTVHFVNDVWPWFINWEYTIRKQWCHGQSMWRGWLQHGDGICSAYGKREKPSDRYKETGHRSSYSALTVHLQLLSVSILWHVNIDCMHTYRPQLILSWKWKKRHCPCMMLLMLLKRRIQMNTLMNNLILWGHTILGLYLHIAFLDNSINYKKYKNSSF